MTSRLESLAYRMLGSVADAQDVVADARLKLFVQSQQPASEEAYLFRVVTNLCIDRLRAEKVRRKFYSGPWLPDPCELDAGGEASDADGANVAEFAEQLSIGFMLLLEELSPAQRVTFVLREGFDYSFAEVAQTLGVSVEAARQHATRARARLSGVERQPRAMSAEHQHLLESLMDNIAAGNVENLMQLLTDDAIALTDGGGVVSAAIVPVRGRERIVQVFLHLAQKAQSEGELSFEFRPMNGTVGLIVKQNDQLQSCFQVEALDGLVHRIYVMRNPRKLAHLL